MSSPPGGNRRMRWHPFSFPDRCVSARAGLKPSLPADRLPRGRRLKSNCLPKISQYDKKVRVHARRTAEHHGDPLRPTPIDLFQVPWPFDSPQAPENQLFDLPYFSIADAWHFDLGKGNYMELELADHSQMP